MHLTLLVPDLLWPEAGASPPLELAPCPSLKRMLARGRLRQCAPLPLEHALCQLFAHAPDAAHAAFRWLGETGAPEIHASRRWLCADPVHLAFHQNRLVMTQGNALGILPDEARQLVDALNDELPEYGHFHAPCPERWYLQPAGLPPLLAPPLSTMNGRSIDEALAEMLDEPAWRRLLTRIQTLLHAHPLNRRRENAGQPAINSLWPWGDGVLPARQESRFDGLWSMHPLACGLARAAGVPDHPLPPDAAHFLAHAAPQTQHLIVLENLTRPLHEENQPVWQESMAALENHWFAPLQQALSAGKIQRLSLHAPCRTSTLDGECARTDRWKFWRQDLPRPES